MTVPKYPDLQTMPHPSPSKHAVFSFFSGAGFLDLGFEAAKRLGA
jgi:hypothetical protein